MVTSDAKIESEVEVRGMKEAVVDGLPACRRQVTAKCLATPGLDSDPNTLSVL